MFYGGAQIIQHKSFKIVHPTYVSFEELKILLCIETDAVTIVTITYNLNIENT